MPKLIKDRKIIDDSWEILGLDGIDLEMNIPAGQVIIPLALWNAQKEKLSDRISTLGVWLNSDQFAEDIGDDCTQLPVIALNFPTFMDGRSFTTARLLRERYNYPGEIRAIGHVIRDQLFYLKRCGFNSFYLGEEVDLESALESLNDFSEFYQPAADEKTPLFRRRA